MIQTALITGASKGIGKELAHVFAENRCNLVLVARSADELHRLKTELQKKYDIGVYVLVADLAQPDAARRVFDELKSQQLEVYYLVNNAGFGDYGAFAETSWQRYEAMIALNVTTLTHFCHLFASDWKKRGRHGKILNIASTAAFQPGPMMAVYFAGKSFVLSLSEAIGKELEAHGIAVTTLCPGPTDTNFGAESKMNASDLVKNVKIADAREVAELGFYAMMRGKKTVVHGMQNRLVAFGVQFLPRKWVMWLSAKVMRRS